MLEQILQLVSQELSGENALRFTERLTHYHRIPGTGGYQDAVHCVEDMLRECGLTDLARQRVPLAQGTRYWKWDLGQRCYQDEARLELVEPWPELLLDTRQVPICIARGSQPTPPSGETADVVDAGAGDAPEHYEGLDVAGKVVLSQGKPDVVAALAIHERGAIGILNSALFLETPPLRTRRGSPGLIQWQALLGRNQQPETARGWGFAISHTMLLRLQDLLRRGRVRVRAVVRGGWRDSQFDNLIATIPGDCPDARPFWFVAHLCHTAPGAGDNASGCGLMVEIARTLVALIGSGQIPRPQAEFRFLFCPEMIGSLAYVHDHPSQLRGSLGGFCLDMVGQDQAKTGGALYVTRAPNALPSLLSDLTAAVLELQEPPRQFWRAGGQGAFQVVSGPYVGLSDHYNFCDADVGVPMLSLIQWPDRYYHTSHDTIDKLSPYTFARVGRTTASAALALSLPGEALVRETLEFAAHAAEHRLYALAEKARRGAEAALSAGDEWQASRLLAAARADLETAVAVEAATLGQGLGLLPASGAQQRIEPYLASLTHSLGQQAKAQADRLRLLAVGLPSAAPAAVTESPIPRRQSRGPLDYTDFYQTTTTEDFEAVVVASEFWNYIDGRRSVDEIKRLLRLEYGPLADDLLDGLFRRMLDLGYAAL